MQGRGVAALCLIVTGAAFAWGYSQFIEGLAVPRAVFVCPVVIVLALGGLVDPRIMSAMGPHGKAMPAGLRVIAFVLFGVGAALSIGLFLWAPSPGSHPASPPPSSTGGHRAARAPHS